MRPEALANTGLRGKVVPGGARWGCRSGWSGNGPTSRWRWRHWRRRRARQSCPWTRATSRPAGGGERRAVQAAQVDLVLVDVAVVGPGGPALPGEVARAGAHPHDAPVVVLCRSGEGQWAREAAVALGCAHVVELPLGAPWLVSQLAPQGADRRCWASWVPSAASGPRRSRSRARWEPAADCLLVDADPDSSGLDLPLGIPEGSGVRWSEIPDPATRWTPGCCDPPCRGWVASPLSPAPGSARGWRPAVARGDPGVRGGWPASWASGARSSAARCVDAGRGRLPAGLLGPGDPVALVLPATLAGVVAGRRVLGGLGAQQVVVLLRPTGLVARRRGGRAAGGPGGPRGPPAPACAPSSPTAATCSPGGRAGRCATSASRSGGSSR